MELISSKGFNKLLDAQQVNLFTLKNARGLTAQVCNHGARLVSLFVPDKNAVFKDVVLGCSRLEDYLHPAMNYFGATIGPFANRIANGRFTLDGENYVLERNHGNHNLHSGTSGVHNKVWEVIDRSRSSIKMAVQHGHGMGGYPGNIDLMVEYKLTNQNELRIAYNGTSDSTTHINLTHHSYFNLSGDADKSIVNHILQINADVITEVNEDLIPTGDLISVKGTPLDFVKATEIGKRIDKEDKMIQVASGYDHNFVLKGNGTKKPCAILQDPVSGIKMSVLTTEPGLHFFSGNFEVLEKLGKRDSILPFRSGLCLEAQHFPDSPNHPHFPSTKIEKGDKYSSTTVYQFE